MGQSFSLVIVKICRCLKGSGKSSRILYLHLVSILIYAWGEVVGLSSGQWWCFSFILRWGSRLSEHERNTGSCSGVRGTQVWVSWRAVFFSPSQPCLLLTPPPSHQSTSTLDVAQAGLEFSDWWWPWASDSFTSLSQCYDSRYVLVRPGFMGCCELNLGTHR